MLPAFLMALAQSAIVAIIFVGMCYRATRDFLVAELRRICEALALC